MLLATALPLASQQLGGSRGRGAWTLGLGSTQQLRGNSVRQGGQRQDGRAPRGLGDRAPVSQPSRGTAGRCHEGKGHQTAHGAEAATSSITKRSQQT